MREVLTETARRRSSPVRGHVYILDQIRTTAIKDKREGRRGRDVAKLDCR